MARTVNDRWRGTVSREGKTDRDRQLMTELSRLVTELLDLDGAESVTWRWDTYSTTVDGWVNRWQEKLDVAKAILGYER